jgi:hypothetical protein
MIDSIWPQLSVLLPLEHDPEKCAAVFRKDHAHTITYGAMVLHPEVIALKGRTPVCKSESRSSKIRCIAKF